MMRALAIGAIVAACRSQPPSRGAVSGEPERDRGVPAVTVSAIWPGHRATEVAALVTSALEQHLLGISGLAHITSRAVRGETSIWLEFAAGTSEDAAAMAVGQALAQTAPFLPASLPVPPTYAKVGRDAAVLRLVVSGALPISRIDEVADSIVAQKLSQVAGVGEVWLCGAGTAQWTIAVEPARLAAYGTTIRELAEQVRSATATPDQLSSVRDVAMVKRGRVSDGCAAFAEGMRVVSITIAPQPGADRAATRTRLEAVLRELAPVLPQGLGVRELPATPPIAYELELTGAVGEATRSKLAKDLVARVAGTPGVSDVLVEAGRGIDHGAAPDTIAVYAVASDGARLRETLRAAVVGGELVLREPDEHVVGLAGADADQLDVMLAAQGAALRADPALDVRGLLGRATRPTLVADVDRAALTQNGVGDAELMPVLDALQPEGLFVSTVYTQGSSAQVVVKLADPNVPDGRVDPALASSVMVRGAGGALVPLAQLVRFREIAEPAAVWHRGGFPWRGLRVAGPLDVLQAALAKLPVPAGVERTVD